MHQTFKTQNLVTVGAGRDWDPVYTYSCEDWAQEFGISYPLVDDASYTLTRLFGVGVDEPAYHVIIDHTMTVQYSGRLNELAIMETIERLVSDLATVGIDRPRAESEWFIPERVALHEAYPNPFNPFSTIQYDLPKAIDVQLVVYDLLGREVIRLVDGYKESGYHQVVWRGRTTEGREVPAGIYIARLDTPEFTKSIKMVLLK